jgi:hypothetical protein
MTTNSPFKEEFLHFLWRTKKLPYQAFETTDGRLIEILEYGVYNTDAGPDFFNAKVRIDDTVWAGNVEMHVFSSDWKKHKHQQDKAYENVILHVVFENDLPVNLSNKTPIPTLELKGKIPKIYIDNYLTIFQSTAKIPCQHLIKSLDKDKISLWIYTLAIERLAKKTEQVMDILTSTNQNWEETLYILLARYFGSKVNTEPFERLARSLPLSIIHKNKDKRSTIDAIVFGQAGMLQANYTDDYFIELRKEYEFQQKKYALTPIDVVAWKFSKMRPMNFPTVRLAQFAGLMYKVTFLFSQIKEAINPSEIRQILRSEVSPYWHTHYRFGTESSNKAKTTSADFVDLLLINAVAPLLFCYGRVLDDQRYIDKAISVLEDIPAEKNSIIITWKEMDITAKSAFDSQALLQLKTNYCDHFRCLSCKIGNELMNLKK